jgi:Na+/H+ antiporter NhaD/arsenite permease-like protein
LRSTSCGTGGPSPAKPPRIAKTTVWRGGGDIRGDLHHHASRARPAPSQGELGIREPWQFFWATGGLSSFLDNAPTYLALLALAQGLKLAPQVAGTTHEVLVAISLGAVFMGANTYIGNGPNFMVRSIAEARGVRMPGFGGYMLFSAAVLLPVFIAVTLVFFL